MLLFNYRFVLLICFFYKYANFFFGKNLPPTRWLIHLKRAAIFRWYSATIVQHFSLVVPAFNASTAIHLIEYFLKQIFGKRAF